MAMYTTVWPYAKVRERGLGLRPLLNADHVYVTHSVNVVAYAACVAIYVNHTFFY